MNTLWKFDAGDAAIDTGILRTTAITPEKGRNHAMAANRFPLKTSAAFLCLIGAAGMAHSAERQPTQYVLPNGWAISPAGKPIELGACPGNSCPYQAVPMYW